jgi:peroxin-6
MSVKGPELLGSYVGESEANVRAVFQSAREAAEQNAPVYASILFFDELDSLAPKRGGVGDGGGVMERVVATLLAELDTGAPSKSRIFVIGATNRPDLLDPSLLRPGRLDRTVYLGMSTDEDERARILAAQLQRLKLDGNPLEMSRAVVTKLPPRLTGADFSTIASGALLLAVERLCRKADDEQKSSSNELGREIELHEILQAWDEEKCTPTILMNDILKAAENIVPSVSEEELTRYERLKVRYPSSEQTAPIEHEGDVFYQAEV